MHSETYDFKSTETKWQKIWDENGCFTVRNGPKKKFYCLVMFPYPSGKIHMGHARNYCIGDVVARYKKRRGYSVLHPIGWDAFGLPAENAAISNKIDPAQWTKKNIGDMRQDIKSLGISYDWKRECATCDPEYYRWNQWFFIQMFKKGLAYRKKSAVNWCPKCETVLANEQVHDGNCWRCGTNVTQKELDQWFLKITDYAERLLQDLKQLEGKWPEEVITMQRNWIGKSTGAEVDFGLPETSGPISNINVFTTRPDTLFGCTFMVLSPEHPLMDQVRDPKYASRVKEYCAIAKKKTKIERTSAEKEKTGVFTGLYAVNPVNDKKIPVWIADYVLSDYGTGAIMAVPAHDQRDFEFAKKFELPIVEVIRPPKEEKPKESGQSKNAYEGEGTLVNSGPYSELPSEEAKIKIIESLKGKGKGKASITYRIRDWLISRQRYWGTPIPAVYCSKCGLVPVDEKELPVLLPKNVQFTGKGKSPLSTVENFVNAACPACKGKALRETDTMDTFVDSSWYYLRYCDPKNEKAPFDSKIADGWAPIDQYIGGIEHACMHLIYSRFFYKVIHDLGMIKTTEPFERLLTQGMVTLGGSAMSKSKGNVVAVEEMVNRYGADTARLFVLFASPPRNQLEWSEEGVQGAWRFLNRIWRLSRKISENKEEGGKGSAHGTSVSPLERKTHQTIKKVEEDIERDFQFNTAIAAMMELLNTLSDYTHLGDTISRNSLRTLILLLSPFAPHLTSEIWEECGYEPKKLDEAPFPSFDPDIIRESIIEIVIQVNGKVRAKISLPAEEALSEEKVIPAAQKALSQKTNSLLAPQALSMDKYKFVPGKLVNFVVAEKL